MTFSQLISAVACTVDVLVFVKIACCTDGGELFPALLPITA